VFDNFWVHTLLVCPFNCQILHFNIEVCVSVSLFELFIVETFYDHMSAWFEEFIEYPFCDYATINVSKLACVEKYWKIWFFKYCSFRSFDIFSSEFRNHCFLKFTKCQPEILWNILKNNFLLFFHLNAIPTASVFTFSIPIYIVEMRSGLLKVAKFTILLR